MSTVQRKRSLEVERLNAIAIALVALRLRCVREHGGSVRFHPVVVRVGNGPSESYSYIQLLHHSQSGPEVCVLELYELDECTRIVMDVGAEGSTFPHGELAEKIAEAIWPEFVQVVRRRYKAHAQVIPEGDAALAVLQS